MREYAKHITTEGWGTRGKGRESMQSISRQGGHAARYERVCEAYHGRGDTRQDMKEYAKHITAEVLWYTRQGMKEYAKHITAEVLGYTRQGMKEYAESIAIAPSNSPTP